jgi:hypothetical protein
MSTNEQTSSCPGHEAPQVTSKDCVDRDDWTETDDHELAILDATALQLNREFVRFLVDANVRECGLTDDTKTKMSTLLDVLHGLRKKTDALRARRNLVTHRRQVELRRREQERERRELERQRQRDADNVLWRRTSRWVGRHLGIGKKNKTPKQLDAAPVKTANANK